MTDAVSTKVVEKNAVPTLMYYDVFKNYYANLQEEDFYIIGNSEKLTVTINGKTVNPDAIASNEGRINNTSVITIAPKTILINQIIVTGKQIGRAHLNSSHSAKSRMPSSA